MKDVQNRERTAPAKPLVAIGELQCDYVSSKNDRSNKKKLISTPGGIRKVISQKKVNKKKLYNCYKIILNLVLFRINLA